MFLLKLLFIIGLLLLIAVIAYTIYNKVTHPSKSLMECLPFYDEMFRDQDEVSDFSDQIPDEIQAGNSTDDENAAIQAAVSTTSDDATADKSDSKSSERPSDDVAKVAEEVALKTNEKSVKSEKVETDAQPDDAVKAEEVAPSKTKAKKAAPKAAPAKKAATAKAAPKKTASKAKAAPKKAKASTKGDNIKKVNGIGPVFEKKLNAIGINTFEQIAKWTDADVERIDEELELKGRPQREEWVQKAKTIIANQGE